MTHEYVFATIDIVGAARQYRSARQRWAGLRILFQSGNIKPCTNHYDNKRRMKKKMMLRLEQEEEEEPNGFTKVKHLKDDQRHLRNLVDFIAGHGEQKCIIRTVMEDTLHFVVTREKFWASQ